MAYYVNGTLISGANTLPKMTMAEYLALPVSERPTYWECTDKDYDEISAEDVSYGSGTVEDALDERTSFIDTNSSAIASITTIGGSWTATQNCWAVARARKESASSANPQIFLGSITMMNVNGLDYAFVVFPVMKGQTVSTRNIPSVVYNIEFYPTV